MKEIKNKKYKIKNYSSNEKVHFSSPGHRSNDGIVQQCRSKDGRAALKR
jgi:hypothetical protein